MGAWGSGHFDNDDAGDFVGELVDSKNWSVVEAAFDAVLSIGDGDYLEAPEASMAVAAAAIVAHALGTLAANIAPEDVPAIGALGSPDTALVTKARAAVARLKKQSELGDLWEEAGEKDEWLATIDQLEQAL
ncbi:MAG: DUF4259 domain-containing protein [Hyphomonadaceae bacterium]|nr:DUF4259 domain-containing protein [Hyphomonadaceae bacterium]